jgi:diguanylate cyclase (GGDEF)-like protein
VYPAVRGRLRPSVSFRSRLTLFFVLIVIVPMVSVAVVLFRLISDNESGKADAALNARQRAALNMYGQVRDEAGVALARIGGGDQALAAALRAGDLRAARARAAQLVRTQHLDRLVLIRRGKVLIDTGSRTGTFPASSRLTGAGGRSYGTLQVSVTSARDYAIRVRRITGVDCIVRSGGRIVASTLPGVTTALLPAPVGDLTVKGRDYRAASFDTSGFLGSRARVAVLTSRDGTGDAVRRSRLLAGGILAGFFILAFSFAVAVSRSLQQQIAGFLEAARRLGRGDFSAKVPTAGSDEFAALGQEFNTMAAQLESRLRELGQERTRVERSMRRLGEAVASNLDRDALLEIVVATAVDGVGADGGRAIVRAGEDRRMGERARAGVVDGMEEALRTVERRALERGEAADLAAGEVSALAHPLHETDEGAQHLAGVVSVGRNGRPFTMEERELFAYLAGQAAVSVENVGLHETATRQAVTDELTGLFNHRHFQETLASEVERAHRFGQGLGLVMLDIDNFKSVNDTYGHQQGDLVLREVARIVRESSREIDAPSRYGGEELAVVLPGTELEGAFNLAERMRIGIEKLRLPLVDGPGSLRVTASFGVAALPLSGDGPRELIAAADGALYQAKRAGKNITRRAQ